MTRRVLVAGIGNIFFGDDAFGVEVVKRLIERGPIAGATIGDFGIRGFDLAMALAEEWELAILVDAMPRGGQPGTLYVLEPDLPSGAAQGSELEMHAITPVKVLQMSANFGGPRCRVVVVGCEPTPLDNHDDIQPGMSEAVTAVIEQAAELVESLILEVHQTV